MQDPASKHSDNRPFLHSADSNDGLRRDDVVKHLELIQAVINRMAGNSFLLKGWTVTLVAALFVLASKDYEVRFAWVAVFPTIAFWILDGFFLHQEKRFRSLYDYVRTATKTQLQDLTPFEMDADKSPNVGEAKGWPNAVISKTLIIFYGVVVVIVIASLLYFTVSQKPR